MLLLKDIRNAEKIAIIYNKPGLNRYDTLVSTRQWWGLLIR